MNEKQWVSKRKGIFKSLTGLHWKKHSQSEKSRQNQEVKISVIPYQEARPLDEEKHLGIESELSRPGTIETKGKSLNKWAWGKGRYQKIWDPFQDYFIKTIEEEVSRETKLEKFFWPNLLPKYKEKIIWLKNGQLKWTVAQSA